MMNLKLMPDSNISNNVKKTTEVEKNEKIDKIEKVEKQENKIEKKPVTEENKRSILIKYNKKI